MFIAVDVWTDVGLKVLCNNRNRFIYHSWFNCDVKRLIYPIFGVRILKVKHIKISVLWQYPHVLKEILIIRKVMNNKNSGATVVT
jgi:hypothetical protein